MSTLADELLNDFEDSGEENDEENNDYQNGNQEYSLFDNEESKDNDQKIEMELDGDEEGMDEADEELEARKDKMEDSEDEDEHKTKVEKMKLGTVSDVRNVASLMKTLQPVLEKINHYQSIPAEQRTTGLGSVEDDPEYKLLTQSNSLSTQIDSEIVLVHKFIRDHYSTRFPELETLVSNPLDYAKTVAILQNGPLDNINSLASFTDNIVGAPLRTILDGPTLMIVNVEGTQSRGQALSNPELKTTLSACSMLLQLNTAKHTLTSYVQSRMDIFAPNLTTLIGSLTAAQLLAFTGGLTSLAKTPDRNIPAMGSRRQKNSSLATNTSIRAQGFLYQSPLIQSIPTDLRIQAMRIVSAKLVLAARVDSVHNSRDGTTGLTLRDQCLHRLEKLTEPPPNRGPRALPAPDDKPARKRGGRRARKQKEATAQTDLRKQQNRMAFGKEEREVGYGTGEGTKGLGMIGGENDGRIRATQIDKRTAAKLSKRHPGWGGGAAGGGASGFASSLNTMGGSGAASSLRASGLRTSGVGGGAATAGTASSLAFTPVQGLELVDPKIQAELKRKREAEAAGYFSSGTFTQIGNGGAGSGGGSGKTDAAGFKVPGLPPGKKTNMGPPLSSSSSGLKKNGG